MLIAMTAVVVVGDQHRAAFATYSAVSVLPVNGTRVSPLSRFVVVALVKLDPPSTVDAVSFFWSDSPSSGPRAVGTSIAIKGEVKSQSYLCYVSDDRRSMVWFEIRSLSLSDLLPLLFLRAGMIFL